jgi:DUF1365 family protein
MNDRLHAPAPSLAEAVHVGKGQVVHKRLRPRVHAFVYPTWVVWLPMHRLADAAAAAGLALNRRAAVSFWDADHGDGRGPESGGALAWLREQLAAHGVDDADGAVWLHTYPRVFGYVFNPVSFWYCYRRDGRLRAIVAEVNNTFGERHCYLLDDPEAQPLAVAKCFHVSPFCPLEGEYRFRFALLGDGARQSRVQIDYHDREGPLLITSICVALQEATPQTWRRLLWRYRWHSLAVIARIHWQAFHLWRKGAPFHRQPPPPAHPMTRQESPQDLIAKG